MQSESNTTKRDLSKAISIVTGGGSGVGAATCRLLAEAGAKVVLVGRSADKLQTMCDELGDAAHMIVGDVCDSSFCDSVVAQTIKQYGKVNLLVNNAAVVRRGTIEETTDEDWAAVMRTNVDGVFYMSRAAVKVMPSGSTIVNVASTCGLVGAAGLAAYCTSKGAVVQLTRTMALECATKKITINAVCPGAIEAPMLFSHHLGNDKDEEIRKRNKAAIPLSQLATAQEVARAILYLSQEPHITGSMLLVDGGYTAG